MPERPYPCQDVDMYMIHGRDADGRHYLRCCCDWLTSSRDPRQLSAVLRVHVDTCPDALMGGIEERHVLERIRNAESIEEMDAIWDEDDPPRHEEQ